MAGWMHKAHGLHSLYQISLVVLAMGGLMLCAWMGRHHWHYRSHNHRHAHRYASPPSPPQPLITQVFIASSVAGSLPATGQLPAQPWDSRVTLYAIVCAKNSAGPANAQQNSYYCGNADAAAGFPSQANINGTVVPVARWLTPAQGWGPVSITWATIRPVRDAQYTSALYLPDEFPQQLQRWHDPDDHTWKRRSITPLYQETPLPAMQVNPWYIGLAWQDQENALPGTTPVQYENVMRYRVTIGNTFQGKALQVSTPGATEVVKRYGIADSVAQVVWQRPYTSDIPSNDLLVKYAGANAGCACIFGGKERQFDHYIGMDCSKLPISAWRKFGGHTDGYTTAQGLYDRGITGKYTLVVKDARADQVPRLPVHVGDVMLLRRAGNSSYEHTFIFLGGGTGAYVNPTDRALFVHFDGWDAQGTSYMVADDHVKDEWVNNAHASISVVRLK